MRDSSFQIHIDKLSINNSEAEILSDSVNAKLFWQQMALCAQDQETKSTTAISAPKIIKNMPNTAQITKNFNKKPMTPPVEKIKQLELLLSESNDALAAMMLENQNKSKILLKNSEQNVVSTPLESMKLPLQSGPVQKFNSTPAKRKRSAIFIPPVPAENSTKSATEVSICKFKFTGGAKPSLQVTFKIIQSFSLNLQMVHELFIKNSSNFRKKKFYQ